MNSAQHFLLEALRRLAMSADEQIAYLQNLGVAPSADELALEFTDSIAGQILTGEVQGRVKALDDYLHSVSGEAHASLWEFDALRDSAEWRKVRSLAQLALQALESEPDS